MREETIAIVGGCGHVGLPLGIIMAEAGYRTLLLDRNAALVDEVNAKIMPHMEEDAPQRLAAMIETGMLSASTDPSLLKSCSVVFVTIGTPVDEHLNPRVGDLISAMRELLPYISEKGQLVVFRSTLAPGAVRTLADCLRDWGSPAEVAYCPERIVQGHALTEVMGLPQIVSGFSDEAVQRSQEIFRAATEAQPIVLETGEAELAKLFCNAWRYINFAISNQFYQIAENAGFSFSKIHEAVTSNYPRMKGFARAGLTAGPCLLKDTMQLAAFSQNTFFLGHSSMLINEGLPNFLVEQLLTQVGGSLRGKSVALLGLAFKADNDDTRESLSFKIRKLLLQRGAEVVCHDPFVKHAGFPHLKFVPMEEALECDAIIIGVPHSQYRNLSIPPTKIVIDVWNVVPVDREVQQ